MALLIPTEDSEPIRDISTKITFIYGQRKIGKTTFCSQAPNPLFIATEPGQSHIKLRKIEVNSWSAFLEVCKLIRDGNHDRKTIVIDTIDNLFKFCRDAVLTKHGLVHEQDKGFGQGYDLVNGEFFKILNGLSLLPYGLMMISHSKEKEVKSRAGQKSTRITSTLPDGPMKIASGMADFILYAEVEEVQDSDGVITGFRHVLRTKPTTIYEAGMRLEPGQKFPETIPLHYSTFEKALRGETETSTTNNDKIGDK